MAETDKVIINRDGRPEENPIIASIRQAEALASTPEELLQWKRQAIQHLTGGLVLEANRKMM
jgi:hypothetical protein